MGGMRGTLAEHWHGDSEIAAPWGDGLELEMEFY